MTDHGRKALWPRLVLVVMIGGLPFFPARADPDKEDLARQRDKQKNVRADTDHVVRRTSTMLRVLDYYKIEGSAEKRLLDEVAGTLAGLSKEQMAEVIARLEKAGKISDESKAQNELDQAYDRHRDILARLRELLSRYEAVKTLDQGAERVARAAKNQLELQLRTTQLAQDYREAVDRRNPERRSRGAVLSQIQHEADEQRDLKDEVAQTLKQLEALKEQLPQDEQERLKQAEAVAKEQRVLDTLKAAANQLQPNQRDQNWKSATLLQRKAAAGLQDLARALRAPSERLAALREARERITLAMDKQDSLQAESHAQQDPRIRDQEKLPRQEGSPRRAQEMGDRQARLGHDTHEAQNILKPHAADLANKLAPAEQAMHEAEQALRKKAPAEALKPQGKAAQTLDDVRKDLDRMIAQAEKQRSDPLAALQKAAEGVDQLIREQKDTLRKTREAEETRHPEQLSPLARKQGDLARRTDALRQEPMPAKPQAQAALDKAVQAMEDASKALQDKKSAEAVPNQKQAVKSLEEAQKQLGEQIAGIEKRREETAALEAAAQKLDELTKKEEKVSHQAKEMAGKNESANAKDLAKQQGELTPQAKEIGKQIEKAAPEAAEHVARSAQRMNDAKRNLETKELPPAAQNAEGAAKELQEAQKALAKALDEMAALEIADQAAMDAGKTDPANAAQQLAKALEQAKLAARNSQQATEQQKAQKDASQALARSQEANEGARAALEQAQAQAPRAIQAQLQKAGQQLGQAGQELGQGSPEPANQAQQQAVSQIGSALKSLNTALAAMGQPQSRPGQPSRAQASAAQPGQAQTPGQGQRVAQGKSQKPSQGQERNQSKGTGDRMASEAGKDAPSRLKDVQGEGSFLHMPVRQREMILQALTGKLPPEYAAMIQQYYINVAGGKPAAKLSGPETSR